MLHASMQEVSSTLANVLGEATPTLESELSLIDITDPKAFIEALLKSREFRLYVVNGLVSYTFPPSLLIKLLDHLWGKPPERVEHTGKDGKPIELVTEVRRVIVRVDAKDLPRDEPVRQHYTTH
jgi:hypothetical protein